MNTLSDTLNDLIIEVEIDSTASELGITQNERELLIEEYVERIKNELNVEKYLQ
jgi:hypothetical protein